MTIRQAIEKAIEGGYYGHTRTFIPFEPSPWTTDTVKNLDIWTGSVFLEPLFWQGLSKTMGWKQYGKHEMKGNNLRCSACGEKPHVVDICTNNLHVQWKDEWHRFIDHLAEGKTSEEFFNNLYVGI